MNFKYKLLLTVAISIFESTFAATTSSSPESKPIDIMANQDSIKTSNVGEKNSISTDNTKSLEFAKTATLSQIKIPAIEKKPVFKKINKIKKPENLASLIKQQSIILKELTNAVNKLAITNVGLFGETAGTIANINYLALKEMQGRSDEFLKIFQKAGYILVKLPDGSYALTTNQSLENSKKSPNVATTYSNIPGKDVFMKALTAKNNIEIIL